MSRRAHGLRAWLLQRLTAVYLGLFLVFVTLRFWFHPIPDYPAWHDWLADPLINLATGLFVLSLLIHAWVGVRDVVMDYVRHTGLRVALLALIVLTLAGTGLWVLRVLFVLAS